MKTIQEDIQEVKDAIVDSVINVGCLILEKFNSRLENELYLQQHNKYSQFWNFTDIKQ